MPLNISSYFTPHSIANGLGYSGLAVGGIGLASDLIHRTTNAAKVIYYAVKDINTDDPKEIKEYSEKRAQAFHEVTANVSNFVKYGALTLTSSVMLQLAPHIEQMEEVGDQMFREDVYSRTMNNLNDMNEVMENINTLNEQIVKDWPYYEELLKNTTETLEGTNQIYAGIEPHLPYYTNLTQEVTDVIENLMDQLDTLSNSTIPTFTATANGLASWLRFLPFARK